MIKIRIKIIIKTLSIKKDDSFDFELSQIITDQSLYDTKFGNGDDTEEVVELEANESNNESSSKKRKFT